jgi:hypothetical protein
LAEDAEGKFGVRGREVESMDESADFFVGGSGAAPLWRTTGTGFQVAAGAEAFEQERSETLEIGRGSGGLFLRFQGDLRGAREFEETDGYGLAKIHGVVLFARRNTQEPMAMAEVFIGEATLL